MKKASVSQLLPILRFYSNDAAFLLSSIKQYSAFLQTDAFFRSNSVIWNIPLFPLTVTRHSDKEDVISMLRTRIEENGDAIIPKGFTGVYHSVLFPEEFGFEIETCYDDTLPFDPAIKESIHPNIIIPSEIDYFRSAIRTYYSRTNFKWLIAPTLPSGRVKKRYFPLISSEKRVDIPAICLAGPNVNNKTVLSYIVHASVNPIIILFECSNENSIETLHSFSELCLKRIRRGHTVNTYPNPKAWHIDSDIEHTASDFCWEESNISQNLPHIEFPLPYIPQSPHHRIGRIAAAKQRMTQNAKWDSTKTKICALLADTDNRRLYDDETNSTHIGTAVKRNFIANMPGESYLNETEYQVEFIGGKLNNFVIDGSPLFSGIPAVSYVSLTERRSFQQVTSFSFEDTKCRGLREICHIELPQCKKSGKLVTDYLFIDEYPNLLISLHITYPVFRNNPTVSSYGFFELPLYTFTKTESVRLKAIYPDGEDYFCRIEATEALYEFPGTTFLFSCHGTTLMVMFPQYKQRGIETLPVKVVRRKKHFELLLNPRGMYRPVAASELSGLIEHVPIVLAASDSETLKPLPPSEEILRFIGPSALGADDPTA